MEEGSSRDRARIDSRSRALALFMLHVFPQEICCLFPTIVPPMFPLTVSVSLIGTRKERFLLSERFLQRDRKTNRNF